MAEIAVQVIEALKLPQIDALGFSLGGSIVQHLLIDKPSLIRTAVLVGSAPQGSSGFRQLPDVISTAIKTKGATGRPLRALLFFTDTESGRAEADEYLKNINNHSVDPEAHVPEQTMGAQGKALVTWGSMPENTEQLAQIKQPVLIVNGSDDSLAPTLESVTLFQPQLFFARVKVRQASAILTPRNATAFPAISRR